MPSIRDRTTGLEYECIAADNNFVADASDGSILTFNQINAVYISRPKKGIYYRIGVFSSAVVDVEFFGRKIFVYTDNTVYLKRHKKWAPVYIGARNPNFKISTTGDLVCCQNGPSWYILRNNIEIMTFKDLGILDIWITKTGDSPANIKYFIHKKYYDSQGIFIETLSCFGQVSKILDEDIEELHMTENLVVIRGSKKYHMVDTKMGISVQSDIPILAGVNYQKRISEIPGVGKFYNNVRELFAYQEQTHISLDTYLAQMLTDDEPVSPTEAYYRQGKLFMQYYHNMDLFSFGSTVDLELDESPDYFCAFHQFLLYYRDGKIIKYNYATRTKELFSELLPVDIPVIHMRPSWDVACITFDNNDLYIVFHTGDKIIHKVSNFEPQPNFMFSGGCLVNGQDLYSDEPLSKINIWEGIVDVEGAICCPAWHPKNDSIVLLTNTEFFGRIPIDVITFSSIIEKDGMKYYELKENEEMIYSPDYGLILYNGIPDDIQFLNGLVIETFGEIKKMINYFYFIQATISDIDVRMQPKNTANTGKKKRTVLGILGDHPDIIQNLCNTQGFQEIKLGFVSSMLDTLCAFRDYCGKTGQLAGMPFLESIHETRDLIIQASLTMIRKKLSPLEENIVFSQIYTEEESDFVKDLGGTIVNIRGHKTSLRWDIEWAFD